MDNKEQQGIYDVTYGNKNATPIFKDIESIEDAVIEYIAMYVRGYHSKRNDRGFGAEHIKLHLEKGSEGEVSIEELVNIGNSLRAYLKQFKEAFIDDRGAKVYEWENDDKTRFRIVADTIRENKGEGDNCHSTPFASAIISFYSDRNLNEKMKFKNPKVAEYYENLKHKNVKTILKKSVFKRR
ncbi:hypothetical protein ACRE1U_01050 [Helicobacter himalayensis]|uniref:hypothetical protein n=1 Tax=Helicobacter himalayensis TaxID=1591088 RepID=UPI003D6E552F